MKATSEVRPIDDAGARPPPRCPRSSAQHVLVREAADRRAQRVAEGRADGHHHLVGRRAAPDRRVAQQRRAVGGVDQPDGGRVDLVRQRLQQRPALALQAVAGARPEVAVGVVDGRVDAAVGVDHRRRLEVVRRDPLALHPDDALGDVGEPAASRASATSAP